MIEQNSETQNTDSLWGRAVFKADVGRFDEAKELFQEIIEHTDDLEKICSCQLALGQVEEKRKDYHSAVTHYLAGLQLEPSTTNTLYFLNNNLGYSLNQIQDYKGAIPYLKRARGIDPHLTNAYKNLALSYQGLGDLINAAELFITATHVNASDSRSLHHLESLIAIHPTLLNEVSDLRKRIEACREAVKIAQSV